MSFKVQMQMMGIFGLMPHQMGTLEPSWGRKGEGGREGGNQNAAAENSAISPKQFI
jgi:hypothetical protein